MTNYLISVITHSTELAAPEEQADIDVFNSSLQEKGYWVFAGGLSGPDLATTVDNRGAAPLVTDGPFVETKEFMVGFWIVDVPDLDVALALAEEGSKACNRKVEVRAFLAPPA